VFWRWAERLRSARAAKVKLEAPSTATKIYAMRISRVGRSAMCRVSICNFWLPEQDSNLRPFD